MKKLRELIRVVCPSPLKSAKLADEVVVPDLQVTFFASELYVLRLAANHGVLKDAVAGADTRKPFDHRIGPDLAIRANFHVIFDDGGWVNGHFVTDLPDFQDSQDNRVLWILQILFMMLDCC
jgi:hypothetical protein